MNNFSLEKELKKAKKMSFMGDINKAKSIYKDILQIYPHNLRAKDSLSKIIKKINFGYDNNNEKTIEKKAFKLFNSNLIDELYDFVLEQKNIYPNNLVLLNFLGISEAKKGNDFQAHETFKKILEIDPNNVDALNSVGIVLNEANRYNEAVNYLYRASKIQPRNSSIFNNLGIAYGGKSEFDLAKKNFLNSIKIDNNFDARRNLSTLLVTKAISFEKVNDFKNAITIFCEAKEVYPDNHDVYAGLSTCYLKYGEFQKAESLYQEGLNKVVNTFGFYFSLASFYGSYKMNGRKAIDYANKALELSPNDDKMLNNLALYYSGLLKDDRTSLQVLERAIKINPNSSEAIGNIAKLFHKNGYHEKAILFFLKSLSKDPNNLIQLSNYLFAISLMPHLSDKEVFEEHLKFGSRFNNPKKMFFHSRIEEDSNKKIRLGFVSADFKKHAIMTVLLPFFKNIDKNKFEIYAFSNSHYEDKVTFDYKSHADFWLNCTPLSDYQLAENIWDNKIDILFDMSGHTSGNRLISFSYKPAPIQISWMGYPLTTGLSAMDYTIYDNFFAPKTADNFFVEKILRLPNHFQFLPPNDIEANRPQKERQFNEIIFASFNHSRKLNDDTIDCWSKILKKVENSKIVIANLEPLSFDWIGNRLLKNGIEKSRINLMAPIDLEKYLELHKKVDILLDTWPYSGGTTTAYALMYGIPVVTLAGKNVAQNQSSGIMKNIGIDNSIANTKETYILKAVELASDLEKLYKIKLNNFEKYKTFTEKKQNKTYTNLEELLSKLWKEYCNLNEKKK